jgi:integrase
MSDVIELTVVPDRFERWLAGRPLAERSRREYGRNVRSYCAWLEETPDRAGWQGDPLSDPLARDHAARDYRRFLQVERKAAASTVNLALASLDALYRCLGLGRPNVRREKPARAAPKALDEYGQRRLLRATEAAPVRARALVMLMLFTALRISETVALDVDDVRITARKGVRQRGGSANRWIAASVSARRSSCPWASGSCRHTSCSSSRRPGRQGALGQQVRPQGSPSP